MADITYTTNPDMGLISFFVDGECVTEWSYDDDPEVAFGEFKMIFNLGQKCGIKEAKKIVSQACNVEATQLQMAVLIDTELDSLFID